MFIKCAAMTKKYIILLLFPIFKIIEIVLEKKLLLDKEERLYINLFIIPFLISVGNILCISLWIFRIKLNLRKNETLNGKTNIEESLIKGRESKTRDEKRGLSQVEIFIEEINKKNQMKLLKEIFILFILGLIFLIATILKLTFFVYSFNDNDNLVVFLFTSSIIRFLTMLILSLFFLNEPYKLYRHQKFSIFFIVSLAIIYFFIAIDNSNKSLIEFSLLIGSDILYSIGIICFILTCILYFIIINTEYNNNIIKDLFIFHLTKIKDYKDYDIYINIFDYFEELKYNAFLLIPKLILIFLNNFFEWQILSFFSVNHFNSSYFLYIIIYPFMKENFPKEFWITISFYILVVFFLLIFNEIVIIYSFSLEKNTIHEKRLRSIADERNFNEMGRVSIDTDPIEDDISNKDENDANCQDDKSSIN